MKKISVSLLIFSAAISANTISDEVIQDKVMLNEVNQTDRVSVAIADVVTGFPSNVDILSVVARAIENSYKVNKIRQNVISQGYVNNAASLYYIPVVSLGGDVKQKMDRPGHPKEPMTDFLLNLSASMKIWSNAVSPNSMATFKKLESYKFELNDAIADVYGTTNQLLIKIELSKEFIKDSEKYKSRLKSLLMKSDKSARIGLIKKSDRTFADVAMKKFEESIINIKSQIEGYKSEINNLTSKNIYDEGVHIEPSYIKEFFIVNDEMFDFDAVRNKNFGVLAKRSMLESERFALKGLNETFTVELNSQHSFLENSKSNTKDKDGKASYTYDDAGDSFIGIKISYTGLNFTNHMNEKSEAAILTRKMIEHDEVMHKIKVDISALQQKYMLASQRLHNIETQIALTLKLIDDLFNEIAVDESNALDLFRNISSLSDLEMSRLVIRNEMVDILTELKKLNSNIPKKYITI